MKAAFFKVDHYEFIPKNDARNLIFKHACLGHSQAQLYHVMKFIEEDKIEKATNFLILAANQNNAEALYKLGIINLLNTHTGMAFLLIQKAAENNHLHNQDSWILEFYTNNPQAAQKFLLREALQGKIGINHLLSMLICENGTQTARHYISTSAALGHPDAQYLWGTWIQHENSRVAPKIIFLAASQAQPNALFAAALHRYKNGDAEGAEEFFHYATDLGHRDGGDFLIEV